MKRTFLILCALALAVGFVSCRKDEPEIQTEEEGNSIILNPYKQWRTSSLPAYIGDISSMPKDMQTVIRQRFPKQVGLDAAGIIFAGASDLLANRDKLAAAAAGGSYVVIPGNGDASLLGANPLAVPATDLGLDPMFVCYNGYGPGQYYVMFDEREILDAESGTPSMSEEEWKELLKVNKGLGADGGVSVSDYDNEREHNENYYQSRMDPFVEWVDATYMERQFIKASSSDYDNLRENIEQSGQRLAANSPFTLNKYIDQATFSDPDFLNKSGSITVEFRVYPLYMLSSNGDKAGDYYGVVSTVTPHNQSMWGPYAASHGACRNRIYGFWFSEMDVATSLVNSDGSAVPGVEYFDRPIPENKNDSKTYSNGHTFSVTGSVTGGMSAGKPYLVGQFALGGTWTSSTNYTLETINYTLDSSSPTVKYHYWSDNVKLTDDWDDWSLINQNFPAPVRSEFSAHTMWVWHIPSSVVKDNDTRQFSLKTKISLTYSTWYHWRGAVEYDSNRSNHPVDVPEMRWTLERPDRTPWGFIRLRNATSNEMAHVSFYGEGQESGTPITQLTTSYGKGEEARIGLPEGTYNVVWDIVDGDTGTKIGKWIYRNVKVHQGYDETSSTIRISSVDGQPLD